MPRITKFHLGLLFAAAAAACNFGAEHVVVPSSDMNTAPWDAAATRDGNYLFTADGETGNILSLFDTAGTTLDWYVHSDDPLLGLAVDPSHTDSIRVMQESSIHRYSVSGGQMAVDPSGTVPLPGVFVGEYCDLAVDLNGDVYVTAVNSLVWWSQVYQWSTLYRWDAAAGDWTTSTTLPTSDCHSVSVDPTGNALAVASSNDVTLFDKTDLTVTGDFTTDAPVLGFDLFGGVFLIGGHGYSPSYGADVTRYVQMLDLDGTQIDFVETSQMPEVLQLTDVASTGELRAWVAGDDSTTAVSWYEVD